MALPAGADPGSTGGMGKVDDMRKLREAQHEQGQRAASAKARTPAPPPVDIKAAVAAGRVSAAAVTTPPGYVDPVEDAMVPSKAGSKASPKVAARPAGAKGGKAADETGTCSGCGKPKPMQRGMIGSHQKGLGKMCPGSRKPPA